MNLLNQPIYQKRSWLWIATDSILRLTRVPAAGHELRLSRVPVAGYKLRLTPSYSWHEFRRLDTSCGWFHPPVDCSSGVWIRVAADFVPRWLEFRRLDTSYSWLQPTADSRSGGWIQLKADSILELTMTCGWLELRRLDSTCSWLIL